MRKERVRIIEDFEGFLALEKEWDRCVEAMEPSLPFLTHTWLRVWWASFGACQRLYVMTVWDEDRLVGAWPLLRTSCRILKFFEIPCLQSLVNGQSLISNVICRPSDLDRVLEVFRDHWEKEDSAWELIVLAYVPLTFQTVDRIEAVFRDHGGAHVFVEPAGRGYLSYFIDIRGGFDQYFNGLNKSFRDNRKNIRNRLTRRGGVRVEYSKDFEPAAVERFMVLEDSGWKGAERTSIRSSPDLIRFYTDIAREFARRGEFLLTTLYIDGKAAASIYGISFCQVFYFLKIGIDSTDPELGRLSPGQVILEDLVKHCFDAGMTKFDFYGTCQPFEAHWTKTVDRKKTVFIFNRRHLRAAVCIVIRGWVNAIRGVLATCGKK